MVLLKQISLIQFRNYSSAVFEFPHTVTCITGANGSGKTNLLDAVYYLCYTKSYFSAYQQSCAKTGTDGFRVSGLFNTGGNDITISCKWQSGKKEVSNNGVAYEKITDHIGHFSSVMIAPDDTDLINGGSENRRKWIDSILSQTDKTYLQQLMQYQEVLQQRNAWLKLQAIKPTTDYTALTYYDSLMAVAGEYIFQARSVFLTGFLPLLNDYYFRLSGGKEVTQVTYRSDLAERKLAEWLTQHLEHDLRFQRTLRGIHKDDLEFLINELPLKSYGSQGQKKSFLFALKLAQYAYLANSLGHQPILLLDDVFEKLDQYRMEALLQIITGPGFGQVILTDTHKDRIIAAFGTGTAVGAIML